MVRETLWTRVFSKGKTKGIGSLRELVLSKARAEAIA